MGVIKISNSVAIDLDRLYLCAQQIQCTLLHHLGSWQLNLPGSISKNGGAELSKKTDQYLYSR